MEEADLVIIGAGWFGLTMARTYAQLCPQEKLVVLDAEDSVGGVWSSRRLYPGLKTNNLVGSYENPDLAMIEADFAGAPMKHIPGGVVHNYLERFASTFDLGKYLRLRHKVEKVEESSAENGYAWKLTVRALAPRQKQPEVFELLTKKLVIAAGVTTNANMPEINGTNLFDAPVYHAKDFGYHQGLMDTAKRVVVYGGAKSAWDGVYAYAAAGVQVEWVIRESGKGPCWMAPAYVDNGKRVEDIALTRMFTIFQPWLWTQADGSGWLRRLIHQTWLGRAISNRFWGGFGRMISKINSYHTHEETQKLAPWHDAYWAGTSLSILNYDTNFFDLTRSGKVKIYHSDIVSLDHRSVVLSNGIRLSGVDALHCSTGWRPEPPINFSPPALAYKLGVPTPLQEGVDTKVSARADAAILSRFPRLRDQPNVTPKRRVRNDATLSSKTFSPYRLYRYAVPPTYWEKRNIAIIGTVLTLGQPIAAQCQSLWVSAYFHGQLQAQNADVGPSTDLERVLWETELQTRFHILRTPASTGDKHGELTFETLLYFDLLLGDLGLRNKRKQGPWKEWTEHYGPRDYTGLIDEYQAVLCGTKSG